MCHNLKLRNLIKFILFRAPSELFAYLFIAIVRIRNLDDDDYREISIALGQIPLQWGKLVRYRFYLKTLRRVGRNVNFMQGVVFEGRNCVIGNDVYIGYRSVVFNDVSIGSDVMIAHGSIIMSGRRQHGVSDLTRPMSSQVGVRQHVTIGDNVWVGANACVMNNLSSGVVVGAGTIVIHSVPENSIVVGNPGRIVSRR